MTMLPIFPLNTVLFPGGTMPLHIFEPRYLRMIGGCVEREETFGVALIRSGEEVGDIAEPYDIGTSARITRAERLPDGRLNIVVVGVERFRIRATDRTELYLQAEVDYCPRDDRSLAVDDSTLSGVRSLFERYFRLTFLLGDQWAGRIGMPGRPARLVDFIASRLEISTPAKQALLETDSLLEVLETESAMLEQAVEQLTEQVALMNFKKYRDFGRLN